MPDELDDYCDVEAAGVDFISRRWGDVQLSDKREKGAESAVRLFGAKGET